MAKSVSSSKPRRLTPLWIVSLFVGLTETVLGIAVTQIAGGTQIALTIFVMVFLLLVASFFFVTLWSRPWVFYSPSEYGGIDPIQFIETLAQAQFRRDRAKPADTVQARLRVLSDGQFIKLANAMQPYLASKPPELQQIVRTIDPRGRWLNGDAQKVRQVINAWVGLEDMTAANQQQWLDAIARAAK